MALLSSKAALYSILLSSLPFIAGAQNFNFNINDQGVSVSIDATEPLEKAVDQAVQAIRAKVIGNIISLPDGRDFSITVRDSGPPSTYIEIEEPVGAEVQIFYDKKLKFESEIPCVYKSQSYKEIGRYAKVVIKEDHKTWSFKFKPRKFHTSIIRPMAEIPVCEPAPKRACPPPPVKAPTVVVQETAPPPPPPAPVAVAISASDFSRILSAMEDEDFADSRMSVMKSALRTKQLSTTQVAQLMEAFDFGDEKVSVGVYCYPKVVDKDQWYTVYGSLTFDSEKRKLRKKTEG